MKRILVALSVVFIAGCGGSGGIPVSVDAAGPTFTSTSGRFMSAYPDANGAFNVTFAQNQSSASFVKNGNGYGATIGQNAAGDSVAVVGILETTTVGSKPPVSGVNITFTGNYHLVFSDAPAESGPMNFTLNPRDMVLTGSHRVNDRPYFSIVAQFDTEGKLRGTAAYTGAYIATNDPLQITQNLTGFVGTERAIGVFGYEGNEPGKSYTNGKGMAGGFYGELNP